MSIKLNEILDLLFHRRVLRRWSKAAALAPEVGLDRLRVMRSRARQIQRHLSQVVHSADARLSLPLLGSNAIQRPLNADWAYRPEIWRGPLTRTGISGVESKSPLGEEATVFHDCAISELTCRQVRNTREQDLAPFGLRMDVFRFDGSFLSLVIDLPETAIEGLKRNHLIRMETVCELEKPIEIFARLNIKHGPNTDQIVRELPLHEENVMVEFDLAYTKLNEKRVERMWIDLIFEGPEMNQITLRDVTLSRRPRAEL